MLDWIKFTASVTECWANAECDRWRMLGMERHWHSESVWWWSYKWLTLWCTGLWNGWMVDMMDDRINHPAWKSENQISRRSVCCLYGWVRTDGSPCERKKTFQFDFGMLMAPKNKIIKPKVSSYITVGWHEISS